MNNPLFRQQVLEHQKERLYGKVIIHQPLTFVLVTYFLLSLCLVIFIYLYFGNYVRRENVSGYLVPDKGLIKLYVPTKGILLNKFVEEGQLVKKNELLFTVSTLKATSQTDDQDALLLQKLNTQRDNLIEKKVHEEAIFELRNKQYSEQKWGLDNELKVLQASIRLLVQQQTLSEKQFVNYKKLLTNGFVSERNFEESEQRLLDSQSKLQVARQQYVKIENQITDVINQQLQSPVFYGKQLLDIEQSISSMEQRIVEVSGRRTFSIRAPLKGRVTAIQISPGQAVNTLSPLAAILPAGSALRADLFLPTRAVGFVEEGQPVFLRYNAFPYQHYGLQSGHVLSITKTILSPKELPIPLSLQEPVYRVQVELDRQFVKAFGKSFSLQSGMLLEADIVLESRSIGQWLLAPLYGLSGY